MIMYLNISVLISPQNLLEWNVKVNKHELFMSLWSSESFQGDIFETSAL